MAAFANIMKSIEKTPKCKPSARVGHRAPEQRAWVNHRLNFKPHHMSNMQWQALQQNKQHNLNRERAVGERIRAEDAAVVHIQRAWRTKKGHTYTYDSYDFPPPAPMKRRPGEQTDSESSDSDSDSDDALPWPAIPRVVAGAVAVAATRRRDTPSAGAKTYQTTVQSAVKIQRWWWMWRFRKWLPKRRKYREWVRTNNFLPVHIEFEFPFRQDPLLLGRQLLGVDIDKLPF